MCYISRTHLTLHVYLHLILEVGMQPKILPQKSAAETIWFGYVVTPNLRYFSLPEVVWILSMTSLLQTSSGSYA